MRNACLFFAILFCSLQLIAQQNTLKRMWTAPYVLQGHDESFSFQIEANDIQFDSIQAVATLFGIPLPFGEPILSQYGNITDRIVFLDDGLADDKLMGDGIYTASNLKSLLTMEDDDINIPKSYDFEMNEILFFSRGSSLTEPSNMNFQVRFYNPTSVPEINNVNSNFQHTSYVVNIVDEDLEYEEYNLHEAYESYYEHLPDDRHSIIVVSTEISKNTPTFSGKSNRVANDVEGIGLSIFDYSDIHNSNGVLEQCIVLANGSEDGGVLLHELHHRWGIAMPTEFHLSIGGHWLRTFEMSGGGGPTDIVEKIVANGDSTYNVYYNDTRNWNSFHAIDMYLAGYGSVDDIKFPIKVILNPTVMGADTDGSTIMYSEDTLLYITKDLFIEKLGIRSPDYLDARREQRVAMMVRSQRLLTPVELSYFHKIMLEHEKTVNSIYSPYTYFDLCKGEGKLITRIYDFTSSVENDPIHTSKINVFPNPAGTKLNIESLPEHNLAIQSGKILNSKGRVVLNFKYEDKIPIDIDSLSPGVYFLLIKIGEEWHSQQFVKIE